MRGTRLKHRGEPHKLIQVGVIPTPATNLKILSMELPSKAVVLSFQRTKTPMPSPDVGATARSVEATCSAWNRGTAGASPAALTIFLLSGIRVVRPPVKRNGVGAIPT